LTNTEYSTSIHFSAQFGHLEATKTLVERGTAVNNTIEYGVTALMVVAKLRKLEISRYLTEMGADINIRDAKHNNTDLYYAAKSDSVDIIELLLNKGISVNMTNIQGSTPLHYSAQFGHVEATNALVERGAAVNNIDEYHVTARMVAAKSDEFEIVRSLTEIIFGINIRHA